MSEGFYKNWYSLPEKEAYEQRGLHSGYKSRWLIALDEWYPNYLGGWVLAQMGQSSHDKTFYIWVEGADDHALELRNLTEARAQAIFDNLPPLVDQQTFVDLGFNVG